MKKSSQVTNGNYHGLGEGNDVVRRLASEVMAVPVLPRFGPRLGKNRCGRKRWTVLLTGRRGEAGLEHFTKQQPML